MLRRSQPQAPAYPAKTGEARFQIVAERFEIRYHGIPLALTLHEFRLLQTLVEQWLRVFNREALLLHCSLAQFSANGRYCNADLVRITVQMPSQRCRGGGVLCRPRNSLFG